MDFVVLAASVLLAQPPPQAETDLLFYALQQGGLAAIVIVLAGLLWMERRDLKAEREANRSLQKEILEMAMAQVSQAKTSEAAIATLTDVQRQVLETLTNIRRYMERN